MDMEFVQMVVLACFALSVLAGLYASFANKPGIYVVIAVGNLLSVFVMKGILLQLGVVELATGSYTIALLASALGQWLGYSISKTFGYEPAF